LKSAFHVTHPLIPLGDVVSIRWEQATSEQLSSGEVSMLDRVSFDGEVFAGGRLETKMKQFIAHPGDLVVSKIRARQGSIGVVQPASGKVGVTIHYRVLQPNAERVEVIYAWLALRSSYCRAQFLAATGGAMKGEIGEEALLAIKLPLPPLAEQRAIVERWRSAQAQIAAASVRVEKVSERIDYDCYAAIGFKIAERKTPPKVFAAPWAGFGRWSVSFNQQTLTGMNLEAGKYPLATLDSFLTLVQYGTSEKANEQGRGVPVLRIGNIKDRVVDMTNLKHIELPPKTVENLTLKDGDMLIIRTSGSRDLVGTCAVFHGSDQAVFASYLIRLRFDSMRANPDYVCWFLNSALGRQQVDSISRQIMQNNINSEEIRTLRVPLPPLEIQRKLVERVTAARAEIARERAAAAALRQTITVEVEALILGTKPIKQVQERL
jgi:type I restriction enzyme S subunit